MKIKFSSDDNLLLNQPSKFHAMTTIIRSAFEEDGNIIRKFFRRIFVGVIAIMNMRIDISEGIDTNKTSA